MDNKHLANHSPGDDETSSGAYKEGWDYYSLLSFTGKLVRGSSIRWHSCLLVFWCFARYLFDKMVVGRPFKGTYLSSHFPFLASNLQRL